MADTICYNGTYFDFNASCSGVTAAIPVALMLVAAAATILCCVCYRKKRRTAQSTRCVANHPATPPEDRNDRQPVDGNMEVLHALQQQTTGMDNANGLSDHASKADKSPDHMTTQQGTTPPALGKREENKRKLTLSLPLRLASIVKDRATPSNKSESTPHSANKVPTTEHLYDSIDTCVSNRNPVYHILEPPKNAGQQACPNSPHLYHVLECPTTPASVDVGGAASKAALPPPLLPPKPKAFRHRLETCATPTDIRKEKIAFPQRRSVSDQLRSVMAIYEEVPADRKDSTPVTLPPRAAKPEDNAEQKNQHVYHVLEALTPVEKNVIPQGQQKQEEKLKENMNNVIQTCGEVDEKISSVCQTKDEPEVPNAARALEENNYAKPFAPKRKLEDNNSHKCLFDDPSYCTQSHAVGHTSKMGDTPDQNSIANQPQYDDPSYTTPVVMVKQRDPSPNTECLFDDPKYNSAKVTKNDSKLEFDDPKYHLPFRTDQQLQKGKVLHNDLCEMRHSSSVENFSASVYSDTEEFLDGSNHSGRGRSVDNLMDNERSAVYKMKKFNTKHRPNSIANLQYMKVTNL